MQTAKVNLKKQVDSINIVLDIRQVNGQGDLFTNLIGHSPWYQTI